MSIKDAFEENPDMTAFVRAVASRVLVLLLPTIANIIKTATDSTITDERITGKLLKDPLDYFECLKGCENDRDCDGVKDEVDKCPDSGIPAGGCVTKDGCPDSNCDGIPD